MQQELTLHIVKFGDQKGHHEQPPETLHKNALLCCHCGVFVFKSNGVSRIKNNNNNYYYFAGQFYLWSLILVEVRYEKSFLFDSRRVPSSFSLAIFPGFHLVLWSQDPWYQRPSYICSTVTHLGLVHDVTITPGLTAMDPGCKDTPPPFLPPTPFLSPQIFHETKDKIYTHVHVRVLHTHAPLRGTGMKMTTSEMQLIMLGTQHPLTITEDKKNPLGKHSFSPLADSPYPLREMVHTELASSRDSCLCDRKV